MAVFQAPTRLVFDRDVEDALAEIVTQARWRRPAVVIDEVIAGLPLGRALIARLEASAEAVKVARRTGPEPDVTDADALAASLRAHAPDAIVGVGGGSALDLAKAAAVLLTNDGEAATYQGLHLVPRPGLPSVLVPTTAGTGSEVTWTAVFTNRAKGIKAGINSPHLFARHAVLDARLTLTMPPAVMVATAMDALTHAVESYAARNGTDVSRMASREAFRLLHGGFRDVLAAPGDLEARRRLLLGSTIAGWAIVNAGTGACHSIAYALGTFFEVPHGTANAMLLPVVMRVNDRQRPGLYADLWDVAHPGDAGGDAVARSRRLADELEGFVRASAVGFRLGGFGVAARDLEALSESGLRLTSALDNNPAPFARADCRAVLEAIL